MNRALLFATLVFLALPASAADPSSCSPTNLEIGIYRYSLVAIALATVSALITLAYMYSKVREDPAIGMWAKDEGYNMVISVLLFVGVIAFVSGACSLSTAYVGADSFIASTNYLDVLITSNGFNTLSRLTYQSIENQKQATKYLYLGMTPFFGSGVARSASYRALSAHKELVIDLYLPLLASLNAQKYVLQGIEWVSISVLLPFAFVLRIIPFTRDFGNLLLALFFALYIIVPTTYAMSAAAFAKITTDNVVCIDCGVNTFATYGLDFSGATGKDTMFYKIGSVIPQAVFIPNIVIIVAITATMAISKGLKAIAV